MTADKSTVHKMIADEMTAVKITLYKMTAH